MIIHHIKVSSDVFDVLLTKVSEIQLAENDYKVGDKLFIRESNGDRTKRYLEVDIIEASSANKSGFMNIGFMRIRKVTYKAGLFK
ncbi:MULTISPECIES: DUF3850 domain-containing protein [Bacillus]|uniref:DUF3850 domain-containing protein n=1 Tax=Bacillus TaxID=1386 RepID=UPI0004B0188F|nr:MULTISPECIES: DUF3850 domain-containing protein [Bacillus]MCK8099001.1 DUF3850 domain-containing protein [Bacillus sp. 2CMS4F]MCW0118151.1 DUF3850 domain-containing protein [Bacillus subtilis]MDW4545231.1 DUF3850 domain-containing protein [Bacillus subtilis subsp. subtilis]CAF1721749.1 hypothetical protein NRS6099_00554 [Bacillus subtilis]CAF1784764.1 hypothetical protein NRS6105_03944 [Bacillus subtilis]